MWDRRELLLAAPAVLFLSLCLETVVRVRGLVPMTGTYVAAAITNAPIHVGVVAVALRRWNTDLFSTHGARIIRLSLLGMLGIGAAVGIFAPFLYENVYDRLAVVRWALTIGLGAGFYAGYHNTRITVQRIAAERAAVRAEEAADRQELLEYLNAVLRHEVLNAANVITGRASLLQEAASDPEFVDHLEAIERQSDDMADVVDDVRTLLDVNRGNTDWSRVDLSGMVEKSLVKVADRHEEVETDIDLPDEADVAANDLLPRVFENLFRNAIQHNDSSPARITVTGRRTDREVVIVITDNGPGIPTDLREDLFAPNVGSSDHKTRLGTAIVGRLVEQHDGEIRVIETGDGGTTLEVRFPLASASEVEATPG